MVIKFKLERKLKYQNTNFLIFILVIFIIFSIFSCNNNKTNNDYQHYYGVFNDDFYYDNNSLVNNENVKTTIEKNKIDFWIFGLDRKKKKKLFSLINNISVKNKNNKKYIFDNIPIVNKYFYPTNSADTLSIFFNDGNSVEHKDKIYPIYRDLGANILYDTINVDYNNKLNDNTKKYFNLLDQGYILGAISSCEIIGPNWDLKSPIRTVILPRKKNQLSFIEALKKRKTYITNNSNTNMIFKINKNIIGDIITIKKSNLIFLVKVENPLVKIRKIEIFTNNNLKLFSQDSIYKNKYSIQKTFTNNNSFSYYYARVDLQNGDFAFTTPIWIIKDKKFLINNIIQQKNDSISSEKSVTIKYNIDNISTKSIHDIHITIDQGKKILSNKTIDLKIRESRQFSIDYKLSDSTNDEIISINAIAKDYKINMPIKINKNLINKKIAFDTVHFNIFSNMFSKVINTLNDRGYITTKLNKKKFVNDYSYLKQYNLFVMTVPEKVYLLFDKNLDILYTLQKYVYYGGNLILAGFNSPKTQSTTVFFNEILRVLYSPIKFRIKKSVELYPIFDEKANYEQDPLVPVFNIGDRIKLEEFKSIDKIYFRDPVEIYTHIGSKEVLAKNISRVNALVYYNNSTNIKKRKIRNNKNYIAAGLYKFGQGKVCVLSGINFSDYDIDILENKEWFITLVDYLLK